jgi:hypothetical protein
MCRWLVWHTDLVLTACCCNVRFYCRLQTGLAGVTHIGGKKDYTPVINAALAGGAPAWQQQQQQLLCDLLFRVAGHCSTSSAAAAALALHLRMHMQRMAAPLAASSA